MNYSNLLVSMNYDLVCSGLIMFLIYQILMLLTDCYVSIYLMRATEVDAVQIITVIVNSSCYWTTSVYASQSKTKLIRPPPIDKIYNSILFRLFKTYTSVFYTLYNQWLILYKYNFN